MHEKRLRPTWQSVLHDGQSAGRAGLAGDALAVATVTDGQMDSSAAGKQARSDGAHAAYLRSSETTDCQGMQMQACMAGAGSTRAHAAAERAGREQLGRGRQVRLS